MATLQQLDMNILLWIQEHLRVDALTPFWRAVTFLGNGGWFWIVLCVLLICFGKTRKTGVTAALSLLSGFLITNLLIKNAVARPRPFDTYTQIIPLITRPKDYSFPSGIPVLPLPLHWSVCGCCPGNGEFCLLFWPE